MGASELTPLMPGTSASLEIARRLDCLPQILQLEADFAAGVLDTRGFAIEACRLWRELTPEIAAEAFARAPWINGLEDVLTDIRNAGRYPRW